MQNKTLPQDIIEFKIVPNLNLFSFFNFSATNTYYYNRYRQSALSHLFSNPQYKNDQVVLLLNWYVKNLVNQLEMSPKDWKLIGKCLEMAATDYSINFFLLKFLSKTLDPNNNLALKINQTCGELSLYQPDFVQIFNLIENFFSSSLETSTKKFSTLLEEVETRHMTMADRRLLYLLLTTCLNVIENHPRYRDQYLNFKTIITHSVEKKSADLKNCKDYYKKEFLSHQIKNLTLLLNGKLENENFIPQFFDQSKINLFSVTNKKSLIIDSNFMEKLNEILPNLHILSGKQKEFLLNKLIAYKGKFSYSISLTRIRLFVISEIAKDGALEISNNNENHRGKNKRKFQQI